MNLFEAILITFEVVMSVMLIGLFIDKFQNKQRGF
jgi:hypothetical protein